MNKRFQSIIILIFQLVSGCDIIAVNSPNHIVQLWKVQLDGKHSEFLTCLQQDVSYLKFQCRLHVYKEDVALFPERYFHVFKEESKCIEADRILETTESECVSKILQSIKFKAIASRLPEEELEHSLNFKSEMKQEELNERKRLRSLDSLEERDKKRVDQKVEEKNP